MFFKLNKLQFLNYTLPIYDLDIRIPNNLFYVVESSDDYIDTLENRYDIHEGRVLVNGKPVQATFGSAHCGEVTRLYLMNNGEVYFESSFTQEEFKRSVSLQMHNTMKMFIEKPTPKITDYINQLGTKQVPVILEGKEVGYMVGEGKEYQVHITEPGLFDRIVSFAEEDGRIRAKGSESVSIRSDFPPKNNFCRGQPTALGGYFYPKGRGLPRSVNREQFLIDSVSDPVLNPNDKED